MLLLLIFPVLVSGFIACHIHPVYQYRLHRYEGQYLYLKSAELGLYCFFLGTAIASALHYWIPDRLLIGSDGVSLALSEYISGFMTVIGAAPEAESKKKNGLVSHSVVSDVVFSLHPESWRAMASISTF